MAIGQSTVVKEKFAHKLLIEIKCLTECFNMSNRELIVDKAQLSVNNFGKERNCKVTIFCANLEIGKFRVGLILYN